MRTDVKIGLTLSLVVVVVAGWYYLRRSARQEAIPLAVELASANPAPQGEPGADPADEAVTLPLKATSPAEMTGQPAEADRKREAATGLEGMLARGDAQDADPIAEDPLRELIERGRNTAGFVTPVNADVPASAEARGEASPVDGSVATPVRRPIEKNETRATTSNAKARSAKAAPSSRIPSRQRAGTRKHVVGGGDTFAILAEVYYGSQQHTGLLIAANPQVADPQRLLVGTVLNIPPLGSKPRAGISADRRSRPRRPNQPAVRPAKAKAKATPKSANNTYTVKSGDSFYSIAREVLADASRWPELFALNKELVDGDAQRLQPGQILKLPPAKVTSRGDG